MELASNLKDNVTDGPDKRKIFVVKGENKQYIAKNENSLEACIIKIDGGLIKSKLDKKCDYGLCVDDGRFFLIELKGADISQACKQLLATLNYMKSKYKQYEYFCRVVVNKVSAPKLISQSQKKLMSILKDKKHFAYSSKIFKETL